MATIHIVDLKLRGIIGAHPWERVNKQELMVNIVIEYDASLACKSDALKDALDYETVANKVAKIVGRSRYFLLEKLTTKVLEAIMQDPRAEAVWVRVDKPHAIAQAKCVSFELSAQR